MRGEWKESDRELAEQYMGFLPDRVFDVHAHLYDTGTWKSMRGYERFSPEVVTLDEYREQMALILGKRELHGLFFPYPVIHGVDDGFALDNNWVAGEIADDPRSFGQMLVAPTDDPDWVEEEMTRLGFRGLKPFAVYSGVDNYWEAEIPDYLPEPLAAAADRNGWSVTLHLMQYQGAESASNQYWIRHYCETYPNMKLILDHCARGFNSRRAYRGMEKLTGLNNLWIDTAVVCDPFSIVASMKIFGPKRVMYGSDYCMSHLRGINTGVGDTFLWIDDEASVWKGHGHTAEIQPTLVGVENLLAIQAAVRILGLKDGEVEDFFWNNADRMIHG